MHHVSKRRYLIGWLTAFCLITALLQPGSGLAQDDDDGDDIAAPGGGDDANGNGDDDGDDDDSPAPPPPPPPQAIDDDNDDDAPAPAPAPPPPAPAPDNDDDDVPAPVPPPDLDDDRDDDTPSPDLDFDDDDLHEGEDRPVPNQALVRLAPGVDPNAFSGRYGGALLRIIPVPNIALLALDPNADDDQELAALLADPDLIWGEPNFTSQAPEGRPRYFFSSADGEPQLAAGPALPDGLEFTPAAACVTGEDIVVAVLDTGVDTDHPMLASNVLPNGVNMIENTFDVRDAANGIDDDNDGQVDEMVGHGTHVAGTVLQIAPDARILPVKVLNSDGVGDTFSVTASIYYAVEQGAGVINLSLGTTYESIAIQTAVDDASAGGVIVVAAAGNGNRSQPVDYPASADSVISVASITAGADKAVYSNYNDRVDISAPGDDVASAYPGGRYTTASGTSMSAPIVAGGIALILERQSDATPESVYALLESTSSPLNLTDPALEGLLGVGEIDLDASISCSG